MTALDQYQRLEAPGVWLAEQDGQRRDVIVALGDATLMITDANEMALAHWSLPAVQRLNPGRRPAVYTPGPNADERLEIDDIEMMDAIETVRSAIARRRPKPGRLRLWIGAALAVLLIGLGFTWLPSALTRHTVSLLPDASRAAIGAQLLEEITQLAGPACTAPRGINALSTLKQDVFGVSGPTRIVVLPQAVPDVIALPGHIAVANVRLVEDYDTPEVLAGFVLAETLRYEAQDPILALLNDAGLSVTLRLLTTGEIAPEVLHAHAAELLTAPRPAVPTDALIRRFQETELSATPYAYALDVSGDTVQPLLALPAVERGTLLSDADWLSLQDICGR